jgi:hypothetical protein
MKKNCMIADVFAIQLITLSLNKNYKRKVILFKKIIITIIQLIAVKHYNTKKADTSAATICSCIR